jgi:hypothetical protein
MGGFVSKEDTKTMKTNYASMLLAGTLLCVLSGCGSDVQPKPAQAVSLPAGNPAPADPNKVWTLDDKIKAVEKAPMSDDMKKAEIAKLKAGGG